MIPASLFVLGLEQSCNKCATSFKDNDTKHHCRACGEGFCDSCSSKTRPVPERGWGPAPVRVCDNCYEARNVQLGNVGPGAARVEGGTSLLGTGCRELDSTSPALFLLASSAESSCSPGLGQSSSKLFVNRVLCLSDMA